MVKNVRPRDAYSLGKGLGRRGGGPSADFLQGPTRATTLYSHAKIRLALINMFPVPVSRFVLKISLFSVHLD